MAKTIVRELIIALLICLAIILVLGILFYNYVPMSKTIPNEVAYTTPKEVKDELASAGDVDESQIIMTYEVNSSDLSNYARIQNYKPGKANPFSSYETTVTNGQTENSSLSNGGSSTNTSTTSGNTNNSNSSTTSNNEGTTTTKTTTSGGQYFQDKGTK